MHGIVVTLAVVAAVVMHLAPDEFIAAGAEIVSRNSVCTGIPDFATIYTNVVGIHCLSTEADALGILYLAAIYEKIA